MVFKNGNLEKTKKMLKINQAKKIETIATVIYHKNMETVKSKAVLNEGKYRKIRQP